MKLKSFLQVILFIVIFVILQFFAGKLLQGDVKSNTRIMMHELHSVETLDSLFVGASHVYRGIQPEKIDSKLNTHSFVGASANQLLVCSLGIIKEAKYYHPELKHVYVDIDYNMCFDSYDDLKGRLKWIYNVSKYMENPKLKRELLRSATSPKYYVNNFLEIGREKITVDPVKNFQTIKSYINGEYWQYKYPEDTNSNEKYVGKGFILAKNSYQDLLYGKLKYPHFDEDKISKDWINTVYDIIDYCEEEGIEVTFITVPESNFYLLGTDNYDDYIDFMWKLFSEKNIIYHDFNLAKDKYLKLELSDFYDSNHMNINGSNKFCEALTTVLKAQQEGKDTEEFFYENIITKKAEITQNIYGFIIDDNDDKKGFNIITVNNLPETSVISYNYTFVDDKGNETVYPEKIFDSKFTYPENSFGKLKINCFINDELHCQFTKKVYTGWLR